MEPEEESGSTSQNQNLHDLQNYLVTFKNEIDSNDDVLPNMDVDGSDVNDLYSGSGNHLPDPGDGEVSGQFSTGFYSEQGMLGTSLTDEHTQQQGPDSEITTKDGVSAIDLEGVQAQMESFGDTSLNPTMSDLQSGDAHQGIIMTSLGDGLDPNGGKMIQIVSLGGDDAQYLSLGDGQQMQILNSEDLGLTSESLEQIDNSVDSTSSSTAAVINSQTPQMALVSLPGNVSDMPSGGIDIMAPDVKDENAGQLGSAGGSASIFNAGLASLVAMPGPVEGSQPQLFALHRPGMGPESLQMTSLLGADGVAQDLACQTITIVPSDMSQNGEMNYVLILSQPDGSKDGVASVAQICDLKQETTEITDTIIDENGETKNVLRLVPKKLDMGSQQLVCAYCNYTSPKRYLLTRHMKSHSEERPFKCEACSRGFKTAASLLNHVNTHTGTRPHKCKTCDAAFTTSGELVRHIRYRHTFEKPHSCPQCDYASVELSKLKRHMRSHTGERPYKCPSCPYASPDTYKLKRHMRIHTGEKPYECDICHARFTQSNSLKAHKLIHTGNKPIYQCSLCPTTCGRKTDLKIHFNKLHAVGSPLDCKKCGKEFSDRYSYKQHVRTHDMERVFKCDQCDFMAATEKNLELHMTIHGRKYDCDQCTLSFILKHLLDKHKAIFHSNNAVGKDSSIEGGKMKDDGVSGFVTALNQYDLSDVQSESEESSNLLSTPSASDTLHKNLIQDIKEGKLGDVPQVVIVHPDGSQEEISSKLTGDKWSIEELFSTATNNGHTRSEDSDSKEPKENMKQNETELSMTPSDDSSSSAVPLSHHSLLQSEEEETHDLMVCEESAQQQRDSCFSHAEASQLCEASTQAEIESDTDSSGEMPEHDLILSCSSHSPIPKPVHEEGEEEDLLQQISSKTGTSQTRIVSPSSTAVIASSTSSKESLPVALSNISVKSLVTLIKSPPSSSLSSVASSTTTSSPLSLSLSSKPNRKVTSVLQLPKELTGVPNFTVKNNSSKNPPQQYSLLKNLNLSSSPLSTCKNVDSINKRERDSTAKVFVNVRAAEGDNEPVTKETVDTASEFLSVGVSSSASSPCCDAIVIDSKQQEQSNKNHQELFNTSDKIESSATLDIVNDSNPGSKNKSSQEEISHSDLKDLTRSSITTSCTTESAMDTNITEQGSLLTTLTDFKNVEKLSDELEMFLPVIQNSCDNEKNVTCLYSNSCGDNKKIVTRLSFSESEGNPLNESQINDTHGQQSSLEKKKDDGGKTDDIIGSCNVDGQPKDNEPEQNTSLTEINIPRAVKKSKSGKRHKDVDQSLVMTGKRMRKALVKVSL